MACGHIYLQHRLAKTLPHVIDSLLLGSAVGMLIIWRISPLEQHWLIAKITALLLYIFLGMVALRFGRTRPIQLVSWGAALLTAAYIVCAAYTKSPLGPLALIG